MSDNAMNQGRSIESLIRHFEAAQEAAVARFDGLIAEARLLQDQRNLFEEVIENSRDAIFVLESRTGIIRHVNEAASALLGYGVEEMRGRSQLELFPEQLQKRIMVYHRRVEREGGASNLRTRLQRADGSQVDVSISANVLPQAYDGLVVAFVRDITARVAAERQMYALNETLEKRVADRTAEIACANEELEMAIREANRHAMEADAANKAKSFFIANMTHEIRTPLNSVIGMLELLDDMELGEQQRETVDIVRSSAGILANLINQILDFSKIEAEKLELEQVVFLLPELIKQIMDTFGVQARDKKLDLDLGDMDQVPEFVVGDPGRLRQVLLNLLGNAIKFTEKGGVTLTVRPKSSAGRRQTLSFAVKDTGVGIPAEYRKDLFTPFTQADPSITRKFGGTGLGLHISSRLVEKMGGHLEVESEVGVGTTFSFDAHFDKATPRQIESLMDSRSTQDAAPTLGDELDPQDLKILLVEDNPLNQRVALGMLEKLGCTADTADNGIAALRRLDEQVYDIVFMDLQMPDMGGLEAVGVLRSGRAGKPNRQTPVVAMTAHASREDRKECLVAGMDDYVPKPVSTEQICQVMRRVLLGEGRNQDQDGSASGQGNGLAAEVMDTVLSDARHRLNLIIGALQNHDYAFAMEEVHVLEGQTLKIASPGLTTQVVDLVAAINRKQQEFALDVADGVREELDQVGSLVGS